MGSSWEGMREQGLGPACWSLQFPSFPCRQQEQKSQPCVALALTSPQACTVGGGVARSFPRPDWETCVS